VASTAPTTPAAPMSADDLLVAMITPAARKRLLSRHGGAAPVLSPVDDSEKSLYVDKTMGEEGLADHKDPILETIHARGPPPVQQAPPELVKKPQDASKYVTVAAKKKMMARTTSSSSNLISVQEQPEQTENSWL